MNALIIGIDPGINGAVAFVEVDKAGTIINITLISTPSIQRVNAKGKAIACPELVKRIRTVLKKYQASDIPKHAFLESVHSMTRQGVSSSFSFGKAVGIVEGIFSAFDIPITLVTPQKWKKHFGLLKQEKDDSRKYVINNYPELTDQLSLKKHVDKAEAFLIAMYGLELLKNNPIINSA
jgi:crossover junction endodeoxyribonuclease RuvC